MISTPILNKVVRAVFEKPILYKHIHNNCSLNNISLSMVTHLMLKYIWNLFFYISDGIPSWCRWKQVLMKMLQQRHPHIDWTLCGFLGCPMPHPRRPRNPNSLFSATRLFWPAAATNYLAFVFTEASQYAEVIVTNALN